MHTKKSKWTVAFGVGKVPYPNTLQVNFCSPVKEEGYCTILLMFNGAIFLAKGLYPIYAYNDFLQNNADPPQT